MPTFAPGIRPPMFLMNKYEREIYKIVVLPTLKLMQKNFNEFGGEYSALMVQMLRYEAVFTADDVSDSVTVIATEMFDWYHRRFTKQMRKHIGIPVPWKDNPRLLDLFDNFVKRNVDLIVTIPPRLIDQFEKESKRLLREDPLNQEAVKLAARKYQTGKHPYLGRRVGRDQTSKLINQLAEVMQTDAGITSYKWITARDDAVRPEHVANSNKTFLWSSPPPITGPPGQDIQCRCYASPQIP